MRSSWLVIAFLSMCNICHASCVDVNDHILLSKLIAASKPIIKLRTDRNTQIRQPSVSLKSCDGLYRLSFEEQWDLRRFLWVVTFDNEFTSIKIFPPE